MSDKQKEAIDTLSKKAADTDNAAHAMNFSQAALNLAHVVATLKNAELTKG